ncbi:MAG: hypothetical protein PHV02_04730, partial [Rhodocyclaceae bacterium]|nr:hypothetical protein [Rhodocyclaceae bacterium]
MNCSFESWINHLRQLFEPRGVVHVGAGGGPSMVPYQDWGIEQAFLIEADDRNYAALKSQTNAHPGWLTAHAVVDLVNGEKEFFAASHGGESGLIDPDLLIPIWRNLRKTGTRASAATRLDQLLDDRKLCCASFNWLIVACLPAIRIIESLGQGIENLDVVVARVILPQSGLGELEAGLSELNIFLDKHGFRCLYIEETRTPLIAHVIYVRNMVLPSQISEQEFEEQARLAGDRLKELEQLKQAKGAAEKAAGERAQQLEEANKAKEEQARLAGDRLKELEQLKQAKGAAEKAAGERAQQLEEANKAKEEQARLAGDRLKELEQLKQAKGAAEKAAGERAQQLEEANKAKEEQARLAGDRLKELEQLKQAKGAAEKAAGERAQQ